MADDFGLKIGVEGEREFKKALSDINQSFKCFGPVFSTGIGFTWESVRGNLYTQAEEKGESPGRPLRQDRIEPGDYREKPFRLYQKTPKIFPCPSPVFSAKARFVSTVSASGAAFFSERSVRSS